jgi:uncharacterized protein YdcH (DUF465 family)
MKITLKKTNRTELTTLREQLAAALEEQTSSNTELSRLNERQQKLTSEITALENAADSESDAAASKLATKRVQLEQVTRKIAEADSVTGETHSANQDAILSLLRQFARAAAAATGPDIEAYAAEIAAKLRPYCQDDATARQIAFQTPAAKSLTLTYTRAFGSFGFSANEINAALGRADEILSENLSWTFDAKK